MRVLLSLYCLLISVIFLSEKQAFGFKSRVEEFLAAKNAQEALKIPGVSIGESAKNKEVYFRFSKVEPNGPLFVENGTKLGKNVTWTVFERSPPLKPRVLIYHSDEFGRRKTIGHRSLDKDKRTDLITLGCSFTFGDGLADHQTLASKIAQRNSHLRVSNWGIPGAGANVVLKQAENFQPDDEPLSQNLKVVYTFIDAHIDRFLGRLPSLMWLKESPYYELESSTGSLKYKGSFNSGRPWQTQFLLYFYSLFGGNLFKNKIFPSVTESDVEFFCKAIDQVANTFKFKAPGSEFYFYFHPMAGISFENRQTLISCLSNQKIKFIESEVPLGKDSTLDFNSHPSEALNIQLANEITEKIFIKSN